MHKMLHSGLSRCLPTPVTDAGQTPSNAEGVSDLQRTELPLHGPCQSTRLNVTPSGGQHAGWNEKKGALQTLRVPPPRRGTSFCISVSGELHCSAPPNVQREVSVCKERVFVRTSDGAVRQYIPNRETTVFSHSVSIALSCVFDKTFNRIPRLTGAVPAAFL